MLLVLLSVWLNPLLDSIVLGVIDDLFVVSSNASKGYDSFVFSGDDAEAAVLVNITLFDLTNPEDVLAGKAKPCLAEKGPFIYKLLLHKYNISFYDGGNVARFLQRQYVVPATPEDDVSKVNITTPNVIFQTALGLSASLPTLERELIMAGLYPSNVSNVTQQLGYLFDEYTGDQLLFGFNVTLNALGGLSLRYPGLFGNASIADVLKGKHYISQYTGAMAQYGGKVTGMCANYMLAYHNATTLQADPLITLDEMEKAVSGKVSSKPLKPLWGSPRANRVAGSSNDRFCAPIKDTKDSLPLFDFFGVRSIELERDRSAEFQGVKLWRWRYHPSQWKNSSEYPPNADFDMNGPSGMWNMSAVLGGTPLFFSKPYFLDASSDVRDGVECLRRPDKAFDDTYLDVEPITGLTLLTRQMMQGNMHLTPLSIGGNLDYFTNLEPVFLPMYKFEIVSSISNKTASLFSIMHLVNQVEAHGPTWLVAIGIVMVTAGSILLGFVASHVLVTNKHVFDHEEEIEELAESTMNVGRTSSIDDGTFSPQNRM